MTVESLSSGSLMEVARFTVSAPAFSLAVNVGATCLEPRLRWAPKSLMWVRTLKGGGGCQSGARA
eukprot:14332048-Alexandrium_andersonii.AAC.1